MLEGAAIVADVFECLAERKVDIQHLAGRQTAGVGGKRLERGEIGIAGAKGFQIGAIVMWFGVVRPEGQSLARNVPAPRRTCPAPSATLPRLLYASA